MVIFLDSKFSLIFEAIFMFFLEKLENEKNAFGPVNYVLSSGLPVCKKGEKALKKTMKKKL